MFPSESWGYKTLLFWPVRFDRTGTTWLEWSSHHLNTRLSKRPGELFSRPTACAPCCCANISFSCCTILDSSSKTRTRGSPTSNADVAITHATLPAIFPPRSKNEVVRDTRDEILCRVVGGTISTSAARRSYKLSSAAGVSEEIDDRETDDDVRDEADEAYGELGEVSCSSTISTLTMVGKKRLCPITWRAQPDHHPPRQLKFNLGPAFISSHAMHPRNDGAGIHVLEFF